jgi:hypothetical protein
MKLKQIQRMIHALAKEGYHLVKTPIEEEVQSQHEQNNTSKEGESRPRHSTVSHQVNPSPKPSEDGNTKWYRPWVKLKTFACFCLGSWKGGKRVLFVASVFGGVFYAWVTYHQWQDLRNNFKIDQRSWIRVEDEFLVEGRTTALANDGAIVNWPLRVSNVGKSPAFPIHGKVALQVVHGKDAPSFDFKPTRYTNIDFYLLFPGTGDPFVAPVRTTPDSPESLSAPEMKGLLEGRSYLIVFGQMTYRDQFDWHWTRFCAWTKFSQTPSFSTVFPSTAACIAYNSVGDGEPPK